MAVEIYRSPPCPLHFGLGYSLECVQCLAMPTIMPDGSLRYSVRAVTTDELMRWAETYEREVKGKRCLLSENTLYT
jgi:hypothetical protein